MAEQAVNDVIGWLEKIEKDESTLLPESIQQSQNLLIQIEETIEVIHTRPGVRFNRLDIGSVRQRKRFVFFNRTTRFEKNRFGSILPLFQTTTSGSNREPVLPYN